MMKKSVIAMLAVLALSLAACTKAPDQPAPEPQKEDPQKEEPQKEDPKPETPVDYTLKAVDLGLSVQWGSVNLNAAESLPGGTLVAWGETAAKGSYSWSTYRWTQELAKYNAADGKTVADPEDDAASAALGSLWRMPSPAEWEELLSTANTVWTWATEGGRAGYQVKSLKNGNTVFLPATVDGADGVYWSASLSDDIQKAEAVGFDKSNITRSAMPRYMGLAVRPVYGPDFRIVTADATLTSALQDLTVEVVSSLGYKVSSLPEWMTEGETEKAGLNCKIHHFTVSANEGEGSRSGVIVFCNDNNNCVPFSVTQKPLVPEITVSQAALSFPYEETSALLEIGANVAWKASSTADWCQVLPASGTGDAQVSVQVGYNEQREARTARLTFASEDGKVSKTVSVTQAANSGAGGQADWSQSFYHRSLVMRFTATWCGYCPMMASSVKRAMELAPDKLVPLNLHGNGSTLVFSGTSSLMNQYAIGGYPTGIVDGRQEVSNGNTESTAKRIVAIMEETEANYPTASGISLSSQLEGDQLSVDLYLYLRYADDYRVTVLLMESGIIANQEDYNEGAHSNYRHDDVARLSLTNIHGDTFSAAADQSVKHLEYSVSVPSGYNRDNLSVLVYVQRAYGSQTVIRSGNYGNYYVDNAVNVPVGEALQLQYVN